MKILLVIPPQVASYFNAGHHLPLFQTGAFLRTRNTGFEVTCWDASAENAGWREFCDRLIRSPDVVGLMNDFDGVDTFPRTLTYIRKLCPAAKTLTFGRLSKQIPEFFQGLDFDAVVESGDYEVGVENYARWLTRSGGITAGVWVRDKVGEQVKPGIALPPDDWVFPDITEIPYEGHRTLYRNDLNKYCGIPNCLELVVPVARGCPIGCEYCDVPRQQGRRERRITVDATLQYIESALRTLEFHYVSFYAPTFTLRRDWVLELCDRIVRSPAKFYWKCVTTLSHLDPELLTRMAEAGCVRVSIGLETLDRNAESALPILKRQVEADFDQIATVCRDIGIELNCFVMLGLPGDTAAGIEYTVERILQHGARVRPTVYTPYHEMRGDMSLSEVSRYNRQILLEGHASIPEAARYYRLLFANEADRPTSLDRKIRMTTDPRNMGV